MRVPFFWRLSGVLAGYDFVVRCSAHYAKLVGREEVTVHT